MTDAYTLTVSLGGIWTGGHGMACCPAHDDRTPSLSIAGGSEGRLLLHCHAGCDYDAVRTALRGRGLMAGAFRPIGEIAPIKPKEADYAQIEKRSRQARALWQEAQPILRHRCQQ